MSDIIKRTNRLDDPNRDSRLLDGEILLECVNTGIAVFGVSQQGADLVDDRIRCRIKVQDEGGCATVSFLTMGQLDNLIDMLIEVRGRALKGPESGS